MYYLPDFERKFNTKNQVDAYLVAWSVERQMQGGSTHHVIECASLDDDFQAIGTKGYWLVDIEQSSAPSGREDGEWIGTEGFEASWCAATLDWKYKPTTTFAGIRPNWLAEIAQEQIANENHAASASNICAFGVLTDKPSRLIVLNNQFARVEG